MQWYILVYVATDAYGNTSTATRTVNVVDTTAPVFTSSGNYTVNEGSKVIGITSATDQRSVEIRVADGGSVVEFTGGADRSTSPGTLVFADAFIPDYEGNGVNGNGISDSYGCKSGDWNYELEASDGDNTVRQSLCITVVNINDEPPIVTSPGTFAVDENQLAITTLEA